MDSEYDCKFKELKGYIPFLENMIKRLESTSSSSNPRQAQLDKIRSLRDLLLDKRKRMKMENLLKCEQVLINLYAKVEQRDLCNEPKNLEKVEKEKPDLNTVRNKLKSVVSKLKDETSETLPDIARANKDEEGCVLGSKEPALFQRRPNKTLPSAECSETNVKKDLSPQPPKRNYTRVLHSPEPAKPLFSRRTPRKSPEGGSPSYSKKERRKSSKPRDTKDQSKDLNITLKVPEKSLSSLGTKDILSRIINCSDSDVDIGTLRELRSQILGELKQTGSKDDVTDILLRSYKNKMANTSGKNSDEIEEGELSDSESEAIENIYSSIFIMEDQDKSSVKVVDKSSEKQNARKIQIRLVIDSDKTAHKNLNVDITNAESNSAKEKEINQETSKVASKKETDGDECLNEKDLTISDHKLSNEQNKINNVKQSCNLISEQNSQYSDKDKDATCQMNVSTNSNDQNLNNTKPLSLLEKESCATTVNTPSGKNNTLEVKGQSVDIPLINFEETAKKEFASEIDILQALKNEILNETTTVLNTEKVTPALHQPKITKVTNAQEVGSKKRISIEKYKANVKNDIITHSKDDVCKKQSLKLTEKECERFNIQSKAALDGSSDDDDKSNSSENFVCDSSAPKSPDHEDFADTGLKPPVIIPNDPIDKPLVNLEADVDMRKLLPNFQSANNLVNFDNDVYPFWNTENNKLPLTDPRMRRDLPKDSPNHYSIVTDKTRQSYGSLPSSNTNAPSCLNNTTPILSPSIPPNMTPTIPPIMTPVLGPVMNQNPHMMTTNMTPNARSYEVTPSRSAIENDDYPLRKHVYAPAFDIRDNEKSHEGQKPVWSATENRIPHWEEEDTRSNSIEKDTYKNSRSERYIYNKRESYNRMECPATPNHPFGRMECPSTPIPSFGRIENPVNSFNRCDVPPKHNNSYDGRFGRPEYVRKSGSSRWNKPYEYDGNDDKDWRYYNDRGYSSYKNNPNSRSYGNFDSYKQYHRDHITGKSDRNMVTESSRRYNRESIPCRESSVNQSLRKDFETDRFFSNNWHSGRREEIRVQGDVKGFGSKCYYEQNMTRTKISEERYSVDVRSHTENNFIDKTDDCVRRSRYDSSDKPINFNDRRRRAASVGRSLEPNLSSSKSSESKFSSKKDTGINRNFRRACSVGREVINVKESFKDIKADLKTFKFNSDKLNEKINCITKANKNKGGLCEDPFRLRESSKSREAHKDIVKYNDTYSTKYSPRKNCRDPRIHHNKRFGKNESYREYNRSNTKEATHSGIVYTNDNITKGTILGSGYGVKNYKIPKIKRPSTEVDAGTEVNPEKNKINCIIEKEVMSGVTSNLVESNKNNVVKKEKNTTIEQLTPEPCAKETVKTDTKTRKKTNVAKEDFNTNEDPTFMNKEVSNNVEINHQNQLNKEDGDTSSTENLSEMTEKRVTRSGKKYINNDFQAIEKESPIKRTRRARKACIYDSDSDEQTAKMSGPTTPVKNYFKTSKSQEDETDNKLPTQSNISSDANDMPLVISEKQLKPITKESHVNIDEQASFSIPDLDIFPDNNATDPVVENINDLIADLDHDLSLPKNSDIDSSNSDINIDAKIQNIKSCETDKSSISVASENNPQYDYQCQINTKISESKTKLGTSDHVPDLSPIAPVYLDSKDEINKTDNLKQVRLPTESTEPLISDGKGLLQDKNKCDIQDFCNGSLVSKTENEDKSVCLINNKIICTNNIATPDSSINQSNVEVKICEQVLPDSIDEIVSNSNTLKNSTVNNLADERKPLSDSSTSRNDIPNQIDSIETLLSILQNKAKINELMSMLNDKSAENEKIKKKLEKLSKIVEEDDDVQDEIINEDENKEDMAKEAKALDSINLSTLPDDATISVTSENNDVEKENTILPSCEISNKEDADIREQKEKIAQDSDGIKSNENKDFTTILSISENNKPIQPLANVEDISVITTQINTSGEEKSTVETEIAVNERTKKGKYKKKGKGKKVKKAPFTKNKSQAMNITTSDQLIPKRHSRELKSLQDSSGNFMNDIHTIPSIRMCRLMKMSEEKNSKPESTVQENEPIVVLQKCKKISDNNPGTLDTDKVIEKKIVTDQKKAIETDDGSNNRDVIPVNRPGPKSKTKLLENIVDDPYAFETDSVNGSSVIESKCDSSVIDSDDSAESAKSAENEVLSEIKKKVKRKRTSKGWKAGIIKSKNRKKKTDTFKIKENDSQVQKNKDVPDLTCFTDKTYCFDKNISIYPCKLCDYNGPDIVLHFKNDHPHSEIPLSRLNSRTATQAISQCENINFQAIIAIPSKNYVCRFCFKEFNNKYNALENFFWHIVSKHTGEYKMLCSECINVTSCPFNLDIPPPPKHSKGQLLGYICKKCNYTQISLENLKTHVVVRHRDEQTAVYNINLSDMSNKTIKSILKTCENQTPNLNKDKIRVLRSSRSNQSMTEQSDEESDCSENSSAIKKSKETQESKPTRSAQSEVTCETDIVHDDSEQKSKTLVKVEPNLQVNEQNNQNLVTDMNECEVAAASNDLPKNNICDEQPKESSDILDCAHFKIKYTASGSKEYVCCINGLENHYKTALLISFKKHVQIKHAENWDGYCYVCKVIVTPQGDHKFKDCLQHYLDLHIDNFPVLEETILEMPVSSDSVTTSDKVIPVNKSYINVRPLSQLISTSSDSQSEIENNLVLPVIESVISLGAIVDKPIQSPRNEIADVIKEFKYEEVQADIMSKKHCVVLDAMLTHVKLAQIFKCSGRFCSFTTDSAEDALLHASTHTRVGGENSLSCVYCDFDSSGNAIDLVTHVFKSHGCCQYVCGMCFYRAAASQLVNAHIKRVHDNTSTAILQNSIVTGSPSDDDMLTRETAVPLYLCDETDAEWQCKFKTYTPGKYLEHLQTRHAAALQVKCFICRGFMGSPKDLIRHLKTHGLRLYQCTWCVFGADNEAELLAHASAKHPAKQPKAYLRIITNKEGTSEFRVLPMAQLNKTNVPSIQITPIGNKDNPIREAERSIELESLIGQTTQMIQKMTDATTVTSSTPQLSNFSGTETTETISDSSLKSTSIETSPLFIMQGNNQQPTPIVKREIEEILPDTSFKECILNSGDQSDIVYCLDSEDENSAPHIVESLDDSSVHPVQISEMPPSNEEPKKMLLAILYRCAKCTALSKNAPSFKKHLSSCFSYEKNSIPCAHCTQKFMKKDIVKHYSSVHLRKKQTENQLKIIACPRCHKQFDTVALLKRHTCHSCAEPSASNQQINREVVSNAADLETVAPINSRKRSLGSRDKTLEPVEKVKKYGPQDVDRLPINPILDDFVHCSLCGFNTKVRLNMVRHLQLHAQSQPVPQTAPINPVPHLETNEKHFDKMVNLASSSVVSKLSDKTNKNDHPTSLLINPEAAECYPKYVPDQTRHACGAKGCSYISVNESMLKRHWEALHSGTQDFYCVYCPSHQQLDTRRPLTAARIMVHLKMHDVNLYACSICRYYHFKIEMVEKHVTDVHKGAHVMTVRGEHVPTPIVQPVAAPTMDLKPWQCGLCKFKSLLRPEVVNHCAKIHNSKMQYKCAYCAFRTSSLENIPKHQAKSHTGEQEEIFYYYYREGEIADDSDGIPLWEKQRRKMELTGPQIKFESESDSAMLPTQPIISSITGPKVDLNIVKKEIDDSNEETLDDLCKEFGEFCEPNGLKYKCSLCKNVTEDNIDAMQSHLFEELKYRKWGCSICSYKAFHKTGFNDHMQTEHRQNREPIELQIDTRIESWVGKLLQYQTTAIEKNKENFEKQKKEILRANLAHSLSKNQKLVELSSNVAATNCPNSPEIKDLENVFGNLGMPAGSLFCCPKCKVTYKEETDMQIHLEGELNKIRWCCSSCPLTFQNYHDIQFHCRSVHIGQSSRPVEATRDATFRSNWVAAVIKKQKHFIYSAGIETEKDSQQICPKIQEPQDNSLLVVRYEEKIVTPEEQMTNTIPGTALDSDEDNLVIDDSQDQNKRNIKKCQYCNYITVHPRLLHDHTLRHYNLKPLSCTYCGLNGQKKFLERHQKKLHADRPISLTVTMIPNVAPGKYLKKLKVTCLVCLKSFTNSESEHHYHDNTKPHFGKPGDVVVKCCVCSMLHEDVNVFIDHHKACHPEELAKYLFEKLNACNMCNQSFSSFNDLIIHKGTVHGFQEVGPSTSANLDKCADIEQNEHTSNARKRKIDESCVTQTNKRVARKSTAKAQGAFAKKSTTKLPNAEDPAKEFSYYGQNPKADDPDKSILIPFCNTMIPISLKKVPEIYGHPIVRLTDK